MTLGQYRSLLTAGSVAMLWWVAASSGSTADTPDPTRIVAKDFTFVSGSLTVKAGSTVTWANMDDEPHSVVSDTGLFRSGAMDTNESFSFKRMVGTIVVK
jgi:plastocyanin